MDKIFTHSGATGDIIFSLPTIKAMGGGTLIVTNFHKQRYESVKPLLEVQDYITYVDWSDEPVPNSINLDLFRNHVTHHDNIVEAHFKAQGLSVAENQWWRNGWLTLPDKQNFINGIKYSVINRTTNYADPNFNWATEVDYLKTISDEVFFIGYADEYTIFNNKFNTNVKFFNCNFLESGYLIKNAVMFTGCYSAMSTIAMGLGLTYRLEQAPNHTCSSLLMERETIINL